MEVHINNFMSKISSCQYGLTFAMEDTPNILEIHNMLLKEACEKGIIEEYAYPEPRMWRGFTGIEAHMYHIIYVNYIHE